MGSRSLNRGSKAKLYAAFISSLVFLVPVSVFAAHFPPTIISQPTNQTVVFGQSAAFAVSASGTAPLVYQWRLNGTNVPTGTNTNLVVTSVSWGDAGLYSVQA